MDSLTGLNGSGTSKNCSRPILDHSKSGLNVKMPPSGSKVIDNENTAGSSVDEQVRAYDEEVRDKRLRVWTVLHMYTEKADPGCTYVL